MSQTRWNGIKSISNSDAYNLAGDLADDFDTANVVVPVSSDTQRNGLTPPQGSYAGEVVARTDKPGVPLEARDSGGVWNLHPVIKLWANSPRVGSASNLLTNLQTGIIQPIIQCGTIVVNTDANGYSNFAFPQAFPNMLFCWVAMNADDIATGTNVFITQGSAGSTLSTAYFNAWKATGVAYTNQSIRLDWIAIGA